MRLLSLTALSAMMFPALLGSTHIELGSSKRVEQVAQASDATPLIDEQDLRCLALNVYHEARSEPESGQIAVARVTLNRVDSKAFPGSVCAVVKQGGVKRNRCQFSWWCDGRSDQPTDARAWRRAMEIARRVLNEAVPDPTRGALYYHANYTKPSWSRAYHRTTRIGRHLFYRPTKI
ncbi:cell wall hydrolase [Thiorhodococcus mannitoliphagus]|uniref:Cell wall hydrolase n=1 Tax=Thiorhodococcus mannitoliphagus TaxID=329406 RepID=A0A6P1DUR4_9GAMM|nr:cell wall hydrolase [Thiorhodococcus mannitoliphagus]NEX19435.1 cell wall hydrolase [Thiorhodococcus mannitoliphagus]